MLLTLAGARTARAEQPTPAEHDPSQPAPCPRQPPSNAAPSPPTEAAPADAPRFGAYAGVSAALDHGAFAFVLAGRLAATEHWVFGVDAEYNPWFSLDARRFAPGAFNAYATVIYRHPVSPTLALRITGHGGVSVLLMDLVGVPMGSVGPYFGANLLGLSYEFADSWRLIIDPADVALPIPKVTGAPFAYLQYRLTLGIQFGA